MEIWRTVANYITAFSLLIMASYSVISYKMEKDFLECPSPPVQKQEKKDNTRYWSA